MRRKITVVGAGNVGASVVQCLAGRGYADIVMTDVVEGLPQGKALDLQQACAITDTDVRIMGTNSYQDTAGSDVVVITAGVPRKPGMSRDDLLFTNAKIMREVTENIVRYSPHCIIIVVSNPLDAMTQLAYHVSGFPRRRVFGMAGVLDTARFRTFLALELGVSVEDVFAFVLGSHGDAMVPLTRLTTVGGVPITQMLSQEAIARIVKRTQDGGGEIVALLKTGSAFYAPAAAAAQMVDAVVLDKKRILPCTVYLEGEYGIQGLFVGVPVKLGAEGVEEVIQIHLTEEEASALGRSAAAAKELVDLMKL